MNILIMGPAGSGKGTMSAKIVDKYQIPHISTGDMFRENISNGTFLGLTAKKYMDQGLLVPDEITIQMVEKRLLKADCRIGYLLDGFPRTLAQAKALDEITKNIGRPVESVINLTIDFDQLAQRITGRRLCKGCDSIYHIKNNPSKVSNICDVCGSQLYQRSDDTVEQLTVRIEEYERSTKLVLEYFSSEGLVFDVNASQAMNDVFNDIDKALVKI